MIVHDTIRDTLLYVQNVSSDLDAVKNIIEASNSSIGNQISMLNVFVSGFSLLFVIAGVFLGMYISRLEKRVVKIKDDIERKETTVKMLAETVEETDKKIQSDIGGLYVKLREEESLALLKRLDDEPQDITNIASLLLARQLRPDGFLILKTAFLKLLQLGDVANEGDFVYPSYKEQYLLLFFQHYMKFSMMDDNIREELCPFFSKGIRAAFKRDIINTTVDLCYALSDNSATFDKGTILVDYLKAINSSKYSDLAELKYILENNISNQNLLPNAIEKCTQDNVYLTLFGITPPAPTEE